MADPVYPIPTFRPVPYVLPIPAYTQMILDDIPIGYWRLGEALITDPAVDEMDTYTGTYWTNDQAHDFSQAGINNNGSNTAVKFNTGSGMYLPGSSWAVGAEASYEAWIKTSDTGNDERRAISIQKGGEGNYIFMGILTGLLVYGDSGWGISTAGEATLYDNAWHHIVITKKDTGRIYFYVDGGSVGDFSLTTGCGSVNEAPWIGRLSLSGEIAYSVVEPLRGTIDEVAIYDYVLTPTQVADHYNEGKY